MSTFDEVQRLQAKIRTLRREKYELQRQVARRDARIEKLYAALRKRYTTR